eukprot:SAG11_NODE_16439_length_547_cov_1.125000_1_plen_66_part_00
MGNVLVVPLLVAVTFIAAGAALGKLPGQMRSRSAKQARKAEHGKQLAPMTMGGQDRVVITETQLC